MFQLCGFYIVAEGAHFKFVEDNMIPYRTESVHFFALMNSATKV